MTQGRVVDKDRTKHRFIPVEIINRYSVIDTAGDLMELEKTGYLEDMLNSGFITDDIVSVVRSLQESMHGIKINAEYLEAIQKYDLFGDEELIDKRFIDKDWLGLKHNVGRVLSIANIGVMSFPTIGKLAKNSRKSIERDIIGAILRKDIDFQGNYPDGIYSFEGLATASHEQLSSLGILIQKYIAAIESGKLPATHKKVVATWETQYKRNELEKLRMKSENPFKTAKERRNVFVEEFKDYARQHNFNYMGDIPREHKASFINEFADRHPRGDGERVKLIQNLEKDWEILQKANPPRIGKGFTTNQA